MTLTLHTFHPLVSTRHDRAFIRFLHVFKQVGASVLAIECLRMGCFSETAQRQCYATRTDPGYHGVDGSEVSAAA